MLQKYRTVERHVDNLLYPQAVGKLVNGYLHVDEMSAFFFGSLAEKGLDAKESIHPRIRLFLARRLIPSLVPALWRKLLAPRLSDKK